MAKLDRDKITELWNKPKNQAEIAQAAKDNERQLFHAKLALGREDSNAYVDQLFDRVRKMLNNAEKFAKFQALFTFPVPSNQFISKATDEWNKVFYAQDRTVENTLADEKYEDDFEEFLDRINFSSIIEQNLFTKVKQAVNTVAVVDVPTTVEGESSLAEPYVYFIEIGKVYDVDTNYSGTIEYLIFKTGTPNEKNEKLVVLDDEYYRVFAIDDKKELSVTPEIESAHFLEYCPASFIWRDVIDPEKTIRRYNSILEIVDVMDKYCIGTVFAEHIDLYASFPIMWVYDDECETEPVLSPAGVEVAPTNKSPYAGPGSQVTMTVPDGESAKMGVPVGFVDVDTKSLTYNQEKLRRLEVKIIKHLTGVDNEIQNEKAFNESQIRSQYETRHSVLRYWAENMQFIHKFLLTTIGKLRYGDKFMSAVVDYGMDYFLYDTLTATKDYEDSKKAGLPQYIVGSKRKIVQQIITRSSPNSKARFDVLEQLEPYLDLDISKLDVLSPEYELKANFQSYIDRFERENGNIVTFGNEISFEEKIEAIKLTLYSYVTENRKFSEQGRIRRDDVRESGQQPRV